MRDFEILSDVFKGPMHANPQRISSVVRVDVSGPYLQGVGPWQFTASGDWLREQKCRHHKRGIRNVPKPVSESKKIQPPKTATLTRITISTH